MASKPTRDYWHRIILENFEGRLAPPQFDELKNVLNSWESAILDAAITRSDRERLRMENEFLRAAEKNGAEQ